MSGTMLRCEHRRVGSDADAVCVIVPVIDGAPTEVVGEDFVSESGFGIFNSHMSGMQHFNEWELSLWVQFADGHEVPICENQRSKGGYGRSEVYYELDSKQFSFTFPAPRDFDPTWIVTCGIWIHEHPWYGQTLVGNVSFTVVAFDLMSGMEHRYKSEPTLQRLHLRAVTRRAWQRVRHFVTVRSIVLYWNEMTAHLMEVGGVAYERDRAVFECMAL